MLFRLIFLLSFLTASSDGFGFHSHQTFRQSLSRLSSASSDATESPSLKLFSPCKINLFLRIIRKREDGYHDLASLFQAVGFGDDLELSVLEEEGATSDVFTCNMPGVPVDDTNLVLRALKLMREKTGAETYFRANLIKQCPAQAGLGGGSANAATAMFGANELMGKPATSEEMVEWSGDLGSDITFFLSRGTAYCTGRGEIMTPLDPLPPGTPLVIVKPNVGLSTPAVFRALNYDILSDQDPEQLLKDFTASKNGVEGVPSESYINDLEPPAFTNLPELKELKEELVEVGGFDHVMMSGSGTSIFCIGVPDDKEAFDETFGQREDLQVFYAEFISRPEGVWYERP